MERVTKSDEICQILEQQEIQIERIFHDAVFTVEESQKLGLEHDSLDTKNLFVRNKNATTYLLVVLPSLLQVDLRAVSELTSSGRLSFCSERRLEDKLGVKPGSVTVLSLINDRTKDVQLVMHKDVWEAESIRCHPLVNTESVVINQAGLRKFLNLTGHEPLLLG